MHASIKAVIFDMDGTITEPLLDFPTMKAEIGLPQDKGLLESMAFLNPASRARGEEILLRHELDAARRSTLNPGVPAALAAIASRALKTAILTRNRPEAVAIVTARHGLAFDAVVTRDDALPKPDPDGVITAAWRMQVQPHECVMVGDFEFDVLAGAAAGAVTVLLAPNGHSFKTVPDFEIASMDALVDVIARLVS